MQLGITIVNKTNRRIKITAIRSFVKAVLSELGIEKASLSLVFLNPDEIRDYNRRFRNTDLETDVMAFPGEGDYLGDVLVCPVVVEENAKELGTSFEEEMAFVIVHGILHLLGYTDHTPEEKEEMFKLQREILKKIPSIPLS